MTEGRKRDAETWMHSRDPLYRQQSALLSLENWPLKRTVGVAWLPHSGSLLQNDSWPVLKAVDLKGAVCTHLPSVLPERISLLCSLSGQTQPHPRPWRSDACVLGIASASPWEKPSSQSDLSLVKQGPCKVVKSAVKIPVHELDY